jgi:hypothetical protein
VLEDSHKRSCWKNSIGVSVPRPCGYTEQTTYISRRNTQEVSNNNIVIPHINNDKYIYLFILI